MIWNTILTDCIVKNELERSELESGEISQEIVSIVQVGEDKGLTLGSSGMERRG